MMKNVMRINVEVVTALSKNIRLRKRQIAIVPVTRYGKN